MKRLVMEVKNYFNNIAGKTGLTVLGGMIASYINVNDEVEIVTPKNIRKTKILGIKRFKSDLDSCPSGFSAGLLFNNIGDLDFRSTPLPPCPYNPKTNLEEFLAFHSKDNEAENVKVYLEYNS